MGVKVTGQFEPAGAFSIVDGKDVSGHITGSNISGSATGTGSFGKILGDGSDITGISSYTVSNSSNNRVLTSVNSSSGNAEANLTFDGTTLDITGNIQATKIGLGQSNSSNTAAAVILNKQLEFLQSSGNDGNTGIIFSEAALGDNSFTIQHNGAPSGRLNSLKFKVYGGTTAMELFRDKALVISGNITGSHYSGSANSTGSFGRLETAGKISGSSLSVANDIEVTTHKIKSTNVGTMGLGTLTPIGRGLTISPDGSISSTSLGQLYGLGITHTGSSSGFFALRITTGQGSIFSVQNNGSVGIGNTNTTHKLDVTGTSRFSETLEVTGGNISGSATSTGSFGSLKIADAHQGDLLIQGDATTAKLKIRPSANTGESELHFSRFNRDNAGFIEYAHTPDRMNFYAAGPAIRFSLDSTGATVNQALSVGTSITAGGNVSGSATSTGSFGFITGSKIQGTFLGDGNSLDLSSNSTIGSNIFSTVAVAGQSNIVADGNSDTLTLAESTGLGITTNAGNDTVTFALDSAQTTIQTIFNTGLIVGRASGDTTIDFTGDDVIVFDAGASEKMRVDTSGVDITGALTVSTNATIQGDLVVNGSTTTLSTTNLAVGDQFIFAATGSAGSNVDAGLVVQSGSAANTGSAFYHDINSQRWAVAKTVASNAVAVTPNQFVGTITLNSNPPSDSDGEYGVGEMWIETDTQDIFIRTG